MNITELTNTDIFKMLAIEEETLRIQRQNS